MVPIFLARCSSSAALPALLYRRLLAAPHGVAGLFQATSLPFIVAATAIGLELGLMTPPRRRADRGGAAVGADLPDKRAEHVEGGEGGGGPPAPDDPVPSAPADGDVAFGG